MTLQNLLAGGAVVALLSIVEISKIQINPWTSLWNGIKWILRHIGKAINGELIARFDELGKAQAATQEKLDKVTQAQQETQTKLDESNEALRKATEKLDKLKARLDEHIKADDDRDADAHRLKILQFNNELLRSIDHTKEEFNEVLTEIDYYEDYCKHHEDYSNNRAVLAIENIKETYRELQHSHNFLPDGRRSNAGKTKEELQ